MKSSRTGWIVCAVVGFMAVGVAPLAHLGGSATSTMAFAQDTTPRTVSGAVLDDKEEPIVGATVFLKNLKTKAIRSFTSVEKGHYYFAQVSRIEDYELWAEKGGKKSAVKTVSSWDSRSKMVADLKIK
ncbi:MAG: carboxypeptidase-like regulatory domain-containing protein [Terracidiphilus sp.]|nr:carboxypeptidase-like regulatory domain-containing protein [Terracidiphilus sp.]